MKIKLDADEWCHRARLRERRAIPTPLRIDEQQRVGLAIELFDDAGVAGPQAALQAMPMVRTMIHLGGVRQPIWAPIRILTG